MKLDIVIGNPPYNNGMDLDFIKLGYSLSKENCIMIVPAKWQTTADNHLGCASKTINYKQFRKLLVPYIKCVVFYPNALDIFKIRCTCGITYFNMDKQVHEKCRIENRFSSFPECYNSVEYRGICNGETLCNVGNSIISIINKKSHKQFKCIQQRASDKKYCVWGTSVMSLFIDYIPSSKVSHYMTSYLECGLSSSLVLSKDSCIYFESESIEECKSFISYTYTKLFRFLVSCNASGMHGWSKNHTFKFVPAPKALQENKGENPWDHIYTDKELYEYFGIPEEYVKVIENVIKERKVLQ